MTVNATPSPRQTIAYGDRPFVDPKTGRLTVDAYQFLQRLGVGATASIANVTTVIAQSNTQGGQIDTLNGTVAAQAAEITTLAAEIAGLTPTPPASLALSPPAAFAPPPAGAAIPALQPPPPAGMPLLPPSRGGTGLAQAPTSDGQLLIGSAVDGMWNLGTITAGSNVTVTNSAGNITIAAGASAAEWQAGTVTAVGNGIVISSDTIQLAGTYGAGLTNSSTRGFIFGENGSATGLDSLVMGNRGVDRGLFTVLAHAPYQGSSFCQREEHVLWYQWTGTGTVQLSANGGSAGTTNLANLGNYQSAAFEILLNFSAILNAVGQAAWQIVGIISREANAASTVVSGVTVTAIGTIGTIAPAAPTVTADTTNGGLNIACAGLGAGIQQRAAASVRYATNMGIG